MAQKELSIFDTCLHITSNFEGADFGTVVGNFDGQGMSVGVLQFNLKSESFKNYILNHIDPMKYDFFPVPITPLIKLSGEDSVIWAKDNMLRPDGSVKTEWRIAWAEFLTNPVIINLQKNACSKYFHQARCLAGRFGFNQDNKRAMAFFYDVAVQVWNMKDIDPVKAHLEQAQNILQIYSTENYLLWQNIELNEDQQKLVILAHLRALKCKPEWRISFFNRKATIATSIGIVNKEKYDFRKLFTVS